MGKGKGMWREEKETMGRKKMKVDNMRRNGVGRKRSKAAMVLLPWWKE
jgi:hypothetical protein